MHIETAIAHQIVYVMMLELVIQAQALMIDTKEPEQIITVAQEDCILRHKMVRLSAISALVPTT